MFEILFINHASFVLKTKDSSLVSDPWVNGTAFNNSWGLLSNTPADVCYELKNTKNVYITHEHPDHFSVKNLKEFCTNKNFFFQKTKDKRVYSFLKKISANVKEASPNERHKISEDFFISIYPFQDIDSYTFIEINGKRILNLNDCHFKNEKEIYYIKNKFGNIDLL